MASSLDGNKKYRRLGVSLFLLIVLAVAQPFLWRFVHAQALVLQQTRSQEQQIENVKARNVEVQKVLDAESDFLSQLDVVAPAVKDQTQVVERIEQLGDQLGLTVDITVIQTLPAASVVVKEENIVPISVTVQTTGIPEKLGGFIDRVEHTQELSVISSWILAPAVRQSTPTGGVPPVAENAYTLTMDILFFLRQTE